jgi:FMN-dependent NADH-azoreductase
MYEDNKLVWKARIEAIESLAEVIHKHSSEINESSKFVVILDSFIKAFNDSNTKVALKALDIFEKVVPYMKVR